MNQLTSLFLVSILVTCLYLLSTSRLTALIRTLGLQGILLSIVPFLHANHHIDSHVWILSAISFFIKGIVIPHLMIKALRGVSIRREIEPVVGYPLSIFSAVLFFTLSFVVYNLVRPIPVLSSVFFPGALSMALCGLFLVIARKKAITQIAGYLVFENAIYLFGTSLSIKNPLIVELGVLLDIVVGVFVMGVVIYHINREFDTINTQEIALRNK